MYLHLKDSYLTTVNRFDEPWENILRYVHINHFVRPLDEWSPKFIWNRDMLKTAVLNAGSSFHSIFDLIELIMRHNECPTSFVEFMRVVFKREQLAYVIVDASPVAIMAAATKAEGDALTSAIRAIQDAGLSGATAHLRAAAAAINAQKWADSVRESIHAVESVSVKIAPEGNTLASALKHLEDGFHPALRKGFERIYGYASDEQGIRHALLDRDQASAGQDEAVFMLGACASFASFLWRMHQARQPA